MTDTELIDRYAKGDESAFTTLYRKYEANAIAYGMSITGSMPDAYDMYHSALLKTLTYGALQDIRSWRNLLFTNMRYMKRTWQWQQAMDNKYHTPEFVWWQTDTHPEESSDILRRINQLDSKYKSLLEQYALRGFTYQEIARIEEIPIGTVKGRIHRARKELAA